ncbi:MAG: hypothetical protein LBF60_03515 [Treponema sp.]|jgi:hypothetical protein|nr:hypothetical protein [Treponema sp.]
MHVKTSGGFAGGFFFLSFLIGLISGAGFPMILVRALVFALFSFVLSEAIHLVVEHFLIDSPAAKSGDARSAGSHVDISVEDASSAEPSETAVILDRAASGGAESATASDGFLDGGPLLGILPINGALDGEAESVPAETADGAINGADSAGAPTADSPAEDSAEFGAMETLFSNTGMPLKDVKLPDMENATGAFVEKKEESIAPPPRKRMGKSTGALGKTYDPTKAANAIKTLLQQK